MTLTTVFGIVLIGLAMWAFWQWRRQAELALMNAKRYCQQHQLQLLEIHREGGKFRWRKNRFGWYGYFIFAFSSDQETRYQGELWMLNFRLLDIEVPPYRLPAE